MKPLYRTMILVGAGGFGKSAAALFCAFAYRFFGMKPATLRRLFVDFTTDPFRIPCLPNHPISDNLERLIRPAPDEEVLLGLGTTFDNELIQMVRNNDPRVASVSRLMPPNRVGVLKNLTEAAGTPVIGATQLWMSETYGDNDRGSHLYRKLETGLAHLTPNGNAVNILQGQGITRDRIVSDRILVVIVSGAGGGTGNGVALGTAIAVRQLAREFGWNVEIRCHYMCGPYHGPRSEKEQRHKRMVAHTFTEEAEIAATDTTAEWAFPAGADGFWTHKGALLDKVFRHEANERLANDYAACLAMMARTLRYVYCTEAGYALERLWSNELMN